MVVVSFFRNSCLKSCLFCEELTVVLLLSPPLKLVTVVLLSLVIEGLTTFSWYRERRAWDLGCSDAWTFDQKATSLSSRLSRHLATSSRVARVAMARVEASINARKCLIPVLRSQYSKFQFGCSICLEKNEPSHNWLWQRSRYRNSQAGQVGHGAQPGQTCHQEACFSFSHSWLWYGQERRQMREKHGRQTK